MKLQKLLRGFDGPNVTNFYRRPVQWNNFQQYLDWAVRTKPRWVLVGEAAGYKGAKHTGMAFTSENLLDQINEALGLRLRKSTTVIHKERSANTIWPVLFKAGKFPFLWNAFPFHPYKGDDDETNRKPLKPELAVGHEALRELKTLLPDSQFVPIGLVSAGLLQKAGLTAGETIRHPAYGGKTQCERQLTALLK